MWFAVMPTLLIVSTAIYLPNLFAYATNRFFLGTPHKRYLVHNDDAHCFLRDMRISGKDNAFIQLGLENLPDEKEEK